MERLACVKLPFLAMQIALKQNPEWRHFPTVLLERDHPRGRVLEVNKYARRLKIEAGMRYAAALSRSGDPSDPGFANMLRAAVFCPAEFQRVQSDLREALHGFSPHLDSLADLSTRFSFLAAEAGQGERGEGSGRTTAFWLQAGGLDKLYGSYQAWAEQIVEALKAREFYASIVVGFSRFGTYALAHTQGVGVRVLESSAQERRLVRALPLARLDLDARLKESLLQLGMRTLGAFLELPASGIAPRFGKQARQLYDFALARHPLPIRRTPEHAPIARTLRFEEGEFNTERLLFRLKSELHTMAQQLAARALVLRQLDMNFYRGEELDVSERVRPARPSLDEGNIIELLRLRLEHIEFTGTPTHLEVRVEGVADQSEQTRLLSARNDRRWEHAQHALARLRAEFGPQAVLGFKAQDTHLPEERFALMPLQTLERPASKTADLMSTSQPLWAPNLPADKRAPHPMSWLVRRVLTRPEPMGRAGALAPKVREEPYLLSGRWWDPEGGVHREYYYLGTHSGELLWVFYDRLRRGWFLYGRVE